MTDTESLEFYRNAFYAMEDMRYTAYQVLESSRFRESGSVMLCVNDKKIEDLADAICKSEKFFTKCSDEELENIKTFLTRK
jgi:hypothetical protein